MFPRRLSGSIILPDLQRLYRSSEQDGSFLPLTYLISKKSPWTSWVLIHKLTGVLMVGLFFHQGQTLLFNKWPHRRQNPWAKAKILCITNTVFSMISFLLPALVSIIGLLWKGLIQLFFMFGKASGKTKLMYWGGRGRTVG